MLQRKYGSVDGFGFLLKCSHVRLPFVLFCKVKLVSLLKNRLLFIVSSFFLQPEVFSSMATTTSGINIPVEVNSSDIQPVVMIDTLNLSR